MLTYVLEALAVVDTIRSQFPNKAVGCMVLHSRGTEGKHSEVRQESMFREQDGGTSS